MIQDLSKLTSLKTTSPYGRDTFENYFINVSRGSCGGTPTVDFKYDVIQYKRGKHTYNAYYKVLYNEERDVIQIYCKETSDKSGWRANFDFASKYYDSFQYEGSDIQLYTAKGWGMMYNAMKWYIRNQVQALIQAHPCEIEIIGWSLGSAIAQICCQDLFFNFNLKSHVYTFGSVKPWYGKNQSMRDYLRRCYYECYNIGDINDIVTYTVPFPKYFKLRDVKVQQDKFGIFKLLNPYKYHTEYWKKELYEELYKLEELVYIND